MRFDALFGLGLSCRFCHHNAILWFKRIGNAFRDSSKSNRMSSTSTFNGCALFFSRLSFHFICPENSKWNNFRIKRCFTTEFVRIEWKRIAKRKKHKRQTKKRFSISQPYQQHIRTKFGVEFSHLMQHQMKSIFGSFIEKLWCSFQLSCKSFVHSPIPLFIRDGFFFWFSELKRIVHTFKLTVFGKRIGSITLEVAH